MKPATITLIALVLSLSGCFTAREARIESDYSYSGNFRRYRTYDFVTGNDLASDTSSLGEVLRDAVRGRLRSQGYRPAKNRPDLLVSFRIYQGDLRFRGFAQEELTAWLASGREESENTPKEERKGYQPLRLILREGTLLVTLIDYRTNRAVWNGYASGVTVPEGVRGEAVVRRSVRSIFDQYRVFTEGYLDTNK